MKPVPFSLIQPKTMADALKALQTTQGHEVRVLGGGQSLGPMLNLRLVRPAQLIDLSGLDAELRFVRQQGDRIQIGARVTHAQIEDADTPPLHGTAYQEIAGRIAYRSVRNQGTFCGSLANADPASDWVVFGMAVNAEVCIVNSSDQKRQLPLHRFLLGAYTTALRDDELIHSVLVPSHNSRVRWAYKKYCRKIGEFSEASCAAWFDPSRGYGALVVGALGGRPQLLPTLTEQIASRGPQTVSEHDIGKELAQTCPMLDPIDQKIFQAIIGKAVQELNE